MPSYFVRRTLTSIIYFFFDPASCAVVCFGTAFLAGEQETWAAVLLQAFGVVINRESFVALQIVGCGIDAQEDGKLNLASHRRHSLACLRVAI